MRYAKDQKEKTRRHIVETASRVLRRDGLAGSAIVPLMKEAGLTQGAFYKNFASRDELVAEALAHAVAQTRRLTMQWAADARSASEVPIARIIDLYLSERHCENREATCIVVALGPELWRQSDSVRRLALDAYNALVEIVAMEMDASRRDLARPLYMMMAGVLSAARLAGTSEDREAILIEGRRAARLLAGVDG